MLSHVMEKSSLDSSRARDEFGCLLAKLRCTLDSAIRIGSLVIASWLPMLFVKIALLYHVKHVIIDSRPKLLNEHPR